MSSPFVAEIRMFGFNFAPRSWAFCSGQIMAISQNTALFSLLGVTYGGDGRTSFALPNLQGLFPVQPGQGSGLSTYQLGQTGGSAAVTLTQQQIPLHTHQMSAQATGGTSATPVGNMPAELGSRVSGTPIYGSDASITPLAAAALAPAGSSQPHNNLPPFQAVNYCIALQGIFPPRP